MKTNRRAVFFLAVTFTFAAALTSPASVTFTDNFSSKVNYLTNGLPGTIWDGVYFGAGEFDNTGVLGPGQTIQCDADITAANTLTLQSTGTSWENADDDGFFLFKVVTGDFSAIVHIVTPYNNANYNTAGLQARAFQSDGDAFGGTENFVSWTRFDEFNFPNYLRSEVNGNVTQINPGGFPNSAYWLRMDRVGNTFRFFQRTNSTDAWRVVSFPAPVNGTNLTRADLAGQPLQVGIIHATFSGQLGVQYTSFSLTASNMGPFSATPAAVTGMNFTANSNLTATVSWTPAAGSAGSVLVMWANTSNLVKEMPVNGITYSNIAGYGLGSPLPASGYFVVYSGTGSSVTVSNISYNTTYNAAVYSYNGSGGSTAYNHTPPVKTITVLPNQVIAHETITPPNVTISFSANPGKWYWLQYSDSLNPPNWQNVGTSPVLANSAGGVVVHLGGAGSAQRYYRLQQLDPDFALKLNNGAITSLQRTGDAFQTEYMAGGSRLGDATIRYRISGVTPWTTTKTFPLSGIASVTYTNSPDGTQSMAIYQITNGLSGGPLIFESIFTYFQDSLQWSFNITNLSSQSVEIGDLALPLPMNSTYSSVTGSAMKHSFVSGNGSFIFWMRPDSVGPFLLMTPLASTQLEYWDKLSGEAGDGYEVYIHAKAASAIAATNFPTVTTGGGSWRLPTSSVALSPSQATTYGFKFQWPQDYDGVRQALVNEGKIDVHVVPGMTVPTNLFAEIALNTTQTINSVTAEHPTATQIQATGTSSVGTNTYQLYSVQFSQLGENMLTISYGSGQTMYLEFFVTEPIQTLIQKRAAYLVDHQIITNEWYTGLFCDFNMNDEVLITPDNHDTLGNSFQVYEIASDDAGESRPAFLATKEAVYPVQSEVSALDFYIQNFVWGGLQRTTNETSSYGVYGVPDWHTLRTNNDLSIGRGYDYPHIIVMYYEMYKVAKYHPEVTTVLSAQEYLTRAWGTAMALWSFGGGQATQVGLMNEVVIPDLLDDLQAEGMTNQAASLQGLWETKVNYYVTGNADLFASEYAFDATGFESQEAYAKYAAAHIGSDAAMGSNNVPQFEQQLQAFFTKQINANVFDRGWLETAYYYYGSDYRGDMGDDFVVTYMAAMGGWGLLDYALNFSSDPSDYLRLGYASYLCGWSTMNTGTPASNYGYWYPGAINDGGCGGGFEPSPYNTTWLGGQPMHRGAWYYSAEENLGFCGAIRSAATILADDPIFGRFCYGGTFQQGATINVLPLDGVRERFHAMLTNGQLHVIIDTDRFANGQPIVLQPTLSGVGFQLETDNPAAHTARLHLTSSIPGTYTISSGSSTITTLNLQAGVESDFDLPVPAGGGNVSFSISQ